MRSPMSEKQILNPKDVCQEFPISRNQVYKLIRTGKLKAYKLGERGYLIKREDLTAALIPVSGEAKW